MAMVNGATSFGVENNEVVVADTTREFINKMMAQSVRLPCIGTIH